MTNPGTKTADQLRKQQKTMKIVKNRGKSIGGSGAYLVGGLEIGLGFVCVLRERKRVIRER